MPESSSSGACLHLHPGSTAPEPINIGAGVRERIILFQDMQGAASQQIAGGLADYLVLVNVIRWVRTNETLVRRSMLEATGV